MKFFTGFIILLVIVLGNSLTIAHIQSHYSQQSMSSSSLDDEPLYANAKESQNNPNLITQAVEGRNGYDERRPTHIGSIDKSKDQRLQSIQRLNSPVEIDTFEANSTIEFLALVESLNISGTGSLADPYLISGFRFVSKNEMGSSLSLNFTSNYSIGISENQFTTGGIFINQATGNASHPIQLQITNNTFNPSSNRNSLIEIQNSSINSITIDKNTITNTNVTNLVGVGDPLIHIHSITSSDLKLLENTIQSAYSKIVAISNNFITDTLMFNNNTIVLKNQSVGDEIIFENSTISTLQFIDNVIEVASNINTVRTTVGLFTLTSRAIELRKNNVTSGNSYFTFHLQNIGTKSLGASIIIAENELASDFTVKELHSFGQENFVILEGKIWGVVEVKNNRLNEFFSSNWIFSTSINSFASIYLELGFRLDSISLMITQGIGTLWMYNITMGQTNVSSGEAMSNVGLTISDRAFVAGETSYGVRIVNSTNSSNFYSGFLTIVETSSILPSIQLTTFSTGEIIWEVMTENFVANGFYSIYESGELVTTNNWEGSLRVVFPISTSQQVEKRNFTLEVQDNFGNIIFDTVYRTIVEIDFNVPEVPNKSYNFEESEPKVTWNSKTFLPDSYSIYRNGTEVIANQLFENSNSISYDLESLSVGYYNFTVELIGSQEMVKKTVFLEVIREEKPPSLEILSEKTILCVSFCEGKKVEWEFSRQINGTYNLYANSLLLEDGNLQNKINITYSLPTLEPEYKNLTLEVLENVNNMTYKFIYITELSILGLTMPTQTTDTTTVPPTTTSSTTTTSTTSIENFLSLTNILFHVFALFVLLVTSLLLVFIGFSLVSLIKKHFLSDFSPLRKKKQEAVKDEDVKEEDVKEEAVKEEAVKEEAVKDDKIE